MHTRALSSLIVSTLFLFLTLNIGGTQAIAQVQPTINAVPPVDPPWSIDWVDQSSDEQAGSYPSIAFNPSNGQPYISYYDAVNTNLMLAKPYAPGDVSLCPQNPRWTCMLIDGEVGDVGKFSSIAFFQSTDTLKLGISYYDDNLRALKFAEFTPPDTWTIQLIELPGIDNLYFGWYTSLKYNRFGTASIAYYVSNLEGDDELKYAQNVAGNGNCGSGIAFQKWNCLIIDSGDRVGMYVSMDISWDRQLYFAYYDGGAGNLKFMKSYQPVPSRVAGAIADVGISPAMLAPHQSGPQFRIAFYDRTNGKLMLATWAGIGEPCDLDAIWACETIDELISNISQIGIAITSDQQGYPLIAYMNTKSDFGPTKLSIARPAEAIGLEIGNCGDPQPGEMFQYWYCETLDSASYGRGDVSVADHTSIALNSSGLAAIAYREVNYMEQTMALKIAYQYLPFFLPVVSNSH